MGTIIAKLLPYELKRQQLDVINHILNKQHVMGILPTGYGKSECYALIPPIMDHLHPEEKHLAIIISPLKSLMFDQVNRWSGAGTSSAAITRMADMDPIVARDILEGNYSLVFSSPEAIIISPWWDMVMSLRNRICLFAVDEVHCLTKWGKTFRHDYTKVPRLRSLLPKTPVLALTATITQPMVLEICEALHLPISSTKIVAVVPDRPNIYLSIERTPEDDFTKQVHWYIQVITKLGRRAPRAIIYTGSIDTVTCIWELLMSSLGDDAWELIEMFQADIDSKERILQSFPKTNTPLRCVVATVAFGLGVQVPDVRYIIHWGPSKDTLQYWQEVGRCSRDGQPGKAFMYVYPRSTKYVQADMLSIIEETEAQKRCIRDSILENLTV